MLNHKKTIKMKKTVLFLAFIALASFAPWNTAAGQTIPKPNGRFEWAKSYNDARYEPRKTTRGLVADSEGNTYHLMQVTRGGMLDTINPFEDIFNSNTSALLVKRSPDGQYLWHRTINPWEYDGNIGVTCHGLHLLGDTALMMMVHIPLPHTDSIYNIPEVRTKLYYLDTMLTTSETLMPTDSIYNRFATAFITLGLDGTLQEQHFLHVTYLDSLGHPVLCNGKIYNSYSSAEYFDVDGRGNIYVVRSTIDEGFSGYTPLHLHDGGLSGYRFMVDGRQFFTHIPPYPTGLWNQQVLKFSPHFDSLLDASYLIGDVPEADPYNTPMININSFDIHNDQLYFTLQAMTDHDSMPIARSNGLQLEVDSIALAGSGCVLRLDTGLNADLLMQFNYVPRLDDLWSTVKLSATCVDTATGSLFVFGSAYTDYFDGNGNPHKIVYRGDTLDNRNDAFWLRVGIDDGHLLSYGRMHSNWGNSSSGMGIVARNNRVFAQVAYSGSVYFADTTFQTFGTQHTGLALAQWEYEGHEVAIYDFLCGHSNSQPGQLLLMDTTLYITGNSFDSPAIFGDIPSLNGLYLAKMVDTSMRSPYAYHNFHADQSIIWPGSEDTSAPLLSVYPNPTHGKVTITCPETIASATLTSMDGRSEQVSLTAEAPGRYSLDITSHPQAIYLVTIITASGKSHTVRLLKQDESF